MKVYELIARCDHINEKTPMRFYTTEDEYQKGKIRFAVPCEELKLYFRNAEVLRFRIEITQYLGIGVLIEY